MNHRDAETQRRYLNGVSEMSSRNPEGIESFSPGLSRGGTTPGELRQRHFPILKGLNPGRGWKGRDATLSGLGFVRGATPGVERCRVQPRAGGWNPFGIQETPGLDDVHGSREVLGYQTGASQREAHHLKDMETHRKNSSLTLCLGASVVKEGVRR